MAVGAVEGLVAVEQRLDAVRPGGQVREAVEGVAEDVLADRMPASPGARPSTSMPNTSWVFGPSLIWKRGSCAVVGGDQQEQPAVERVRPLCSAETDGEAERARPVLAAAGEGPTSRRASSRSRAVRSSRRLPRGASADHGCTSSRSPELAGVGVYHPAADDLPRPGATPLERRSSLRESPAEGGGPWPIPSSPPRS